MLQTFEGHLRGILGTMDVEEIFQDRTLFATEVREVAATDVSKMGIRILSFVIKDIRGLSFSRFKDWRIEKKKFFLILFKIFV